MEQQQTQLGKKRNQKTSASYGWPPIFFNQLGDPETCSQSPGRPRPLLQRFHLHRVPEATSHQPWTAAADFVPAPPHFPND